MIRRINVTLMFLLEPSSATAQEIVTLPTRDGVTQCFLLLTPANRQAAGRRGVVSRRRGNFRLSSENGEIEVPPGNFLVRSRSTFVEGGVAVAIVDTPSDQPPGWTTIPSRGHSRRRHRSRGCGPEEALQRRAGVSGRHQPRQRLGRRDSRSLGPGGKRRRSDVDGLSRRAIGPGLSGFDYSKIVAPC